MELSAPREQRLGDGDLGPGRERAEAEADVRIERVRDGVVDRRIARLAAGIVKRSGRPQHVEPGAVEAKRFMDDEELAKRRRMILPRLRRRRDRALERFAGLFPASEQEQGLGLGGGVPIGRLRLVRLARDALQHLARDLPGLIDDRRKAARAWPR